MATDEEDYRKLKHEQERAAELERQARDRRDQEKGLTEAASDMLEAAEKKGREELERIELQRSIEKQQDKLRQQLLQEQQRRLDEIDLRHLGPPSERDKGRGR
jgi:ribosomal protein L13